MRHRNAGRRLGVNTPRRTAMMRQLVTQLMQYGRIQTTAARAKELRRVAERVITLSKRVTPAQLEDLQGDELTQALSRRVHAIRMARRWVTDRDVLQQIFSEYSTRYAARPGGYTRILKIGRRPGDQAEMSLIELVTEAYPPAEASA